MLGPQVRTSMAGFFTVSGRYGGGLGTATLDQEYGLCSPGDPSSNGSTCGSGVCSGSSLTAESAGAPAECVLDSASCRQGCGTQHVLQCTQHAHQMSAGADAVCAIFTAFAANNYFSRSAPVQITASRQHITSDWPF